MAVVGTKVEFKIEVEDKPKSVLLVFDRKTDIALVDWESAFRLADTMDQVVKDVVQEFMAAYPVMPRAMVVEEQGQMMFNHYKDLVAIVVKWTDRVRFTSLGAFSLCARALRMKAQDAYLEHKKGICFVYARDGMTLRKLLNLRSGEVQEVR